MNKLDELQEKIGYRFQEVSLLKHALTHSSYTNEKQKDKIFSNERLEFLGDAVLELSSSEFLYHKYPDYPEGQLTRFRAALVREESLLLGAKELGLGRYLIMGKGEERNGGRSRSSIVSDALEALMGAIYLDGGLAAAKEFVNRFILKDIERRQLFFDSKTILQELVQGDTSQGKISYRLLESMGPDHDKKFVSSVYIGDKAVGKGVGKSKKAAEQEAAYNALLQLKKPN